MERREQIAVYSPPIRPRAHATREHRLYSSDAATHDTDEDIRPRMPIAVKRYDRGPVPAKMIIHDQRRQRQGQITQSQQQQRKALKRQRSPIFYVGLGMVILIVILLALQILFKWWNDYQEQQRYGMPRTYQTSIDVGHGGKSHFVAINLNKRVVVTEYLGSDVNKAVAYIGPVLLGDGEEKAPVTLEFRDINGDNKLDMLIVVVSSLHPFINTGEKFRPVKPEDTIL